VGTSIVSRVLNRDPTVSIRPETRERIEKAARTLNYRPNAFARGLKLRRTMTLGVVIPHLAYPVNAEIIKGAERRAALAGYVTLLADADEFLQSGEAYRRLLLEQRVDGLLIASASTGETLLSELAESGLPFVLANRRVPHLGPSVTVDDAKGTEIAVRHLLDLGRTSPGRATRTRRAVGRPASAPRCASPAWAFPPPTSWKHPTRRREASGRWSVCCRSRAHRRRSSSGASLRLSVPWPRRNAAAMMFPASSRSSASTTFRSPSTSIRR
jgi:hypothetical protein